MNKYLFWLVSLGLSLGSCYLFKEASVELYSDADYRQSLHLDSNSDTPMIPIATGIIAAFLVTIVHTVVHLIFLMVLFFQKEVSVIKLPWGSNQKKGVGSIVVNGLATLITIIWLYDFFTLLNIKYFEVNAIFTIIAIAVTFVYAMWIIHLIKNKKQTPNTLQADNRG